MGEFWGTFFELLQGQHDDAAVIQRITQPTAILWHPKKKIFIVAWDGESSSPPLSNESRVELHSIVCKGGELTTWNDNSKRLESFTGLHQASVTAMSWSSNGTRLATGDVVSCFRPAFICSQIPHAELTFGIKSGVVSVWKTDPNGRITQPAINTFQLNVKISEIICKPSSLTAKER